MALPLLKRAAEDGVTFVLTPVRASVATPSALAGPAAPARMPDRTPGEGEQYRFHFDMGQCIGCQCCVVACNEQNGNPPEINWRRVGQIEGGWYPNTLRSYVSMGCNHCVNPTCLSGCPVDAFTKDPATGLVLHDADTCIGCQYCTWNCSYGVPQYNPERGVVGKCDMCHGRLSLGQAPACVSACPTGAIAIEIVNINQWRADVRAAQPVSGLPSGDGSLSTTRLTLSTPLPTDAHPVDVVQVHPEDPHLPLVAMTVLTQLSVGAFTAIWLLQLLGAFTGLDIAAVASVLVGALALGASALHLGRPIYAYRALKMWRKSWLSREVLLFTAFSVVAGLYAGALLLRLPGSALIGALTVALGVGGITASAFIYLVSSRPAWNTPLTVIQFLLSAAVLGPLLVCALGAGPTRWLGAATATAAAAQLLAFALRFLQLSVSPTIELRSSARLLATTLRGWLIARSVLLAIGAIVLPLVAANAWMLWTACGLALSGELLGRYLFFVASVSRHMAAPYLGSEAA